MRCLQLTATPQTPPITQKFGRWSKTKLCLVFDFLDVYAPLNSTGYDLCTTSKCPQCWGCLSCSKPTWKRTFVIAVVLKREVATWGAARWIHTQLEDPSIEMYTYIYIYITWRAWVSMAIFSSPEAKMPSYSYPKYSDIYVYIRSHIAQILEFGSRS